MTCGKRRPSWLVGARGGALELDRLYTLSACGNSRLSLRPCHAGNSLGTVSDAGFVGCVMAMFRRADLRPLRSTDRRSRTGATGISGRGVSAENDDVSPSAHPRKSWLSRHVRSHFREEHFTSVRFGLLGCGHSGRRQASSHRRPGTTFTSNERSRCSCTREVSRCLAPRSPWWDVHDGLRVFVSLGKDRDRHAET